MLRFLNLKTLNLIALVLLTIAVITPNTNAARTGEVWQERLGTYIESVWPEGRDILVNGVNKYLNFGTFSGTSGYGFRDNGGTMQVKNSGGTWGDFTAGGAGAGTVTSVAQTVPTGFTITGSPITGTGTLAIAYDAGYEGLLSSERTNWNTFYTTPSSRITAGTAIDWTGNTLNVDVTGDWTGTLDGLEASQFLRSDATDTATGLLTFSALSTFNADIINNTKNVTDYLRFWNGTTQEQFEALITSDGTVASTTLEKTGGGDLTKRFSTGDSVLDCTPICEVLVTVGTDSSPQSNYTYILESTGALTNSITGWPTAEHIKVNYSFLPSASTIQSKGAYIFQNWNDAASNGNETGHITHITQWIREQGASWFSGTAGEGSDGYVDLVAAGTEAYIKIGAGEISQVHHQVFNAVDTSLSTDSIHVVNHPTTAYLEISDLLDVMVDSTGASMSGKYYNIVIGGIANKTGSHSPVMLNLPSGSYSNEANAINDVDGFDNYAMPREFGKESSTGFFLARVTLKNAGGTTGSLSVSNEIDLRGLKQIQSVSGSGAGGTLTDFSDSNFTLFNNTDPTKVGTFDLSTLTTGNTRVITWPDQNGTMALLSDVAGDVAKVGTPVDNEIGVWTGDGTLEGDSNLTWNGTIFSITGALTGMTSLEIPNGTNPTTDTAGEIALDTTDNQFIVDNGTTDMVFRGEDVIFKATIASTSVEFVSGGVIPLPPEKDGFVLSQYRCYVVGGTSVVINLSDGTSDTETITCATTLTSDTDVATNDTFTAGELAEIQFGTVTGDVNYLSFTAYGHWSRE